MGEWTDLICDYVTHLVLCNYARRTMFDYRGVAKRFVQHFPDVSLREVTTGHIEQYLAARPLSPRSRGVELEKLRAFFKYLTKHRGLLETNPCARVERPRWQPRIRPAPTRVEFEDMLSACQTEAERDFVMTFYFTGLRISELLSLRGRDVDLARRRIQVVGKGGHERIVVFPPSLVDLLASRLRGPDAPLFPALRVKSTPMYDKWVNRMLVELGKRAGLPYKLTAHLLRHAYFRMLKTQGVPVEVAARLGGHRSIQTTVKVYGRLDDDDLQAAYDRHISDIGKGVGSHGGPRRRASSSKPSARKSMPNGSGRVSDSRRIPSNSSTV